MKCVSWGGSEAKGARVAVRECQRHSRAPTDTRQQLNAVFTALRADEKRQQLVKSICLAPRRHSPGWPNHVRGHVKNRQLKLLFLTGSWSVSGQGSFRSTARTEWGDPAARHSDECFCFFLRGDKKKDLVLGLQNNRLFSFQNIKNRQRQKRADKKDIGWP